MDRAQNRPTWPGVSPWLRHQECRTPGQYRRSQPVQSVVTPITTWRVVRNTGRALAKAGLDVHLSAVPAGFGAAIGGSRRGRLDMVKRTSKRQWQCRVKADDEERPRANPTIQRRTNRPIKPIMMPKLHAERVDGHGAGALFLRVQGQTALEV